MFCITTSLMWMSTKSRFWSRFLHLFSFFIFRRDEFLLYYVFILSFFWSSSSFYNEIDVKFSSFSWMFTWTRSSFFDEIHVNLNVNVFYILSIVISSFLRTLIFKLKRNIAFVNVYYYNFFWFVNKNLIHNSTIAQSQTIDQFKIVKNSWSIMINWSFVNISWAFKFKSKRFN